MHQFASSAADSEGNLSVALLLPENAPDSEMGVIKVVGQTPESEPISLYGEFTFSPTFDVDTDSDGILDQCDICPDDADVGQEDADEDGLGDACDLCPSDSLNDIDGDGACEAVDACPFEAVNDPDGDGLCTDLPDYDPCPLNSALDCMYESGFESF